MLKNLLYAILLGIGMAACLADTDKEDTTTTEGGPMTVTTEFETTPTADPADFIIDKGRIGNIRIGMPIKEMQQLSMMDKKLKDTTLQLEGQAYTAYVYSSTLSPSGLLVEQQCETECRVWRIQVRDDNYKTARGIGIGSKYAEVREYHPISSVSMGEAGFVAVSDTTGMSFILDTSQLNPDQIHRLKPNEIPANTVVQGILIY